MPELNSNINESEAHTYESISAILDYGHNYANANFSAKKNRKSMSTCLFNRKYFYLIIVLAITLVIILVIIVLASQCNDYSMSNKSLKYEIISIHLSQDQENGTRKSQPFTNEDKLDVVLISAIKKIAYSNKF